MAVDADLELPFLHVEQAGDSCVAQGNTEDFLGHKICRSDGSSEGVFAEWKLEGDRLEIRNDRFGFFPLYYWASESQIAVSPSITRLLRQGASPELDDGAIAVFSQLGFFLGEDTAFREIRALPPGSELVWERGRLSTRPGTTVGRPTEVREAGTIKRSEAIDEFNRLFRLALERRRAPTERFAVPLSGGRDSRHILLELLRMGSRPLICPTLRFFSTHRDADPGVALEVARALDLPCVVLEQTGSLLDGIGGDVLSAGLFLDRSRLDLIDSGRLEDLARDLCDRRKGLRFLSPAYRRRFDRELAVERVTTELKRHAGAPNPIGSFFFWNRTRREIALAPYGLLNDVGTVFSPYLDHDLYDFLSSLPATMLLDHAFHTDAIHRRFPEHSHLRFSGTRRARHGSWRDYANLSFDVLKLLASGGWNPEIDYAWVVPRLLRCLVDPRYSAWVERAGPQLTYFLQLASTRGTFGSGGEAHVR
jgi:hypothetical protein